MLLDLPSLEKFFKNQEFECTLLAASAEIPRDYLFVHIGNDFKDRDMILQINLTKQLIDQEDKIPGIQGDTEHLYHLQLMVQLPYAVNEECIGELSRLLLLINKSSDIPGLEFSEVDRALFWRNVMIVDGSSIDPYVLITLIGTVLMIVNVFGPFIEAVAAGEKSLQGTVQEIRGLQGNVK